MPDISMCANKTCWLRVGCRRSPDSGTIPDEMRQSWIEFRPGKVSIGPRAITFCEGFRPIYAGDASAREADETVGCLIARLRAAEEEVEIWKSVFPDIAPAAVLPDRTAEVADAYQRGLADGANQEREACAKIADGRRWVSPHARYIAAARRSRAND